MVTLFYFIHRVSFIWKKKLKTWTKDENAIKIEQKIIKPPLSIYIFLQNIKSHSSSIKDPLIHGWPCNHGRTQSNFLASDKDSIAILLCHA